MPAPQLELEQAVARGRIALSEEQVVLVLGIDVVDAPAIGEDLDLVLEAGHAETLVGGEESGNEQQSKEFQKFHDRLLIEVRT